MELLVISYSAPFDTVGSAGEKTHNYYLKSFQEIEDIHVRLISFCACNDRKKLDLDKYGIEYKILMEKQDRISNFKRMVKRAYGILMRPNDKYANFVSKSRRRFVVDSLYQWKDEGYKPDIIILEWTHMILLVDIIKKMYSGIPVVASVHDISYMGSERRWHHEKNRLIKYFRKKQYINLKCKETLALEKCDMIIPQSNNDLKILETSEKLSNKKFLRIVPFYDDYRDVNRQPVADLIIFYGNMSRPENYISVKWFIEKVFKKLKGNWKFAIIGGNPHKTIKKYDSDKIIVTGFLPVKEVEEYFARCTCMVVPLKLGSGIKVKMLEAFSSGIPVLANTIGNEGIFAENGVHYLHCETEQDYIGVLDQVTDGKIHLEKIGQNARQYIREKFNLKVSRDQYIHKLFELI